MTRKNPERQQELVTVAQRLFSTKGYENTSINDIAQAANVTKGAFYHHFASKTAVLEGIIDSFSKELLVGVKAINNDDSLTAISKWRKFMQFNNDWKIERKEEMIEVGRSVMADENIVLRHKLRTEQTKVMAGELAKIIAQGVAEGVFDVEYIPETAEIVVADIGHFSERLNLLLFSPEQYDDPKHLALRHNRAVQTAVERLLGAPTGSMHIIDDETLIAWFTD